METHYIVQGFTAGKRGRVEALPPAAYKTEEEARRRATKLGETCLGVIAFAQTADPEAGEYADPIVLEQHGTVPDLA
ncbi:hypothetical protein SAMN02800692_2024 [Luteibacter sp. UNC138MFCol5.1]|uniref:hypothetical protein n=1 Tax=Luteibacter sp. UNC138MFCol5.1 TaxID=1502774 RepID=UPI0008C176E4|nr:hypothetical protein [Luteibacter sp. UNC138MFCol5.1]SEO76875.1 hypothetical protein SAMN02800692_2024 [Luteibacter sp. UNC138MFCol5.1]